MTKTTDDEAWKRQYTAEFVRFAVSRELIGKTEDEARRTFIAKGYTVEALQNV
jgi:hypothetical protein